MSIQLSFFLRISINVQDYRIVLWYGLTQKSIGGEKTTIIFLLSSVVNAENSNTCVSWAFLQKMNSTLLSSSILPTSAKLHLMFKLSCQCLLSYRQANRML